MALSGGLRARAAAAVFPALLLAGLSACRGAVATYRSGLGDGGDAGAGRDAGVVGTAGDGGVIAPALDSGPEQQADGGPGCGLRTCASAGADCGPIGDGCGGVLDCGSCPSPTTCGGGGRPSVCGGKSGCVVRTCASARVDCGPLGDGCGGLLQCGSCAAPESCGGGGVLSVCGVSTAADGGRFGSDGGCLPRSCASQGIGCGPAGDGCGGLLECGGCPAPAICGGAGVRNACGTPSCTQRSCSQAQASCGPVGNGCGGLLQCGGCVAPAICGGGGVPNACGDSNAGGPPPCQGALAISPGSATLQVANGTASTLQLLAIHSGCGASTAVSASWVTSRPDLASVGTTTGIVSASGPHGGALVVSAGYRGLVATAQLQVVVAQTISSGSSPSDFSGPSGGGGSYGFLYPNDQAVIPVNLQPLDFQWQPNGGSNLYRVTLTGSFATLTGYLSPQNPSQPAWQPDPTSWSNFAQSNVGQTVTVDLAATSSAGGTVYTAPQQTLTLAASRFAGTIYYWAVNLGQILRISAGSTTPQAFYTPSNGGSTCIACHAVSPDGTKLSAELWGGGQPGTVVDLTQTPAAPIVNVGPNWDFSTFDPTGQLLVVSNGGDLTLRSSQNAQPVPSWSGEGNLGYLGCGVGSTCTQPAWSRDGQLLLFIQGVQGAFGNDWTFSQADLLISQWAAGSQTFSQPTVLAANDYDGQALANVYPTVSVDDALVAFTRSPCSYGSGCAENASLELVPATGGAPLELAQAEGGDTSNRFPNFSPFKEGGYHWMAFFSLRNYGWVNTTGNRQIWVTAIDDNGAPSSDPSHPAFWLPGQDPTSQNDKAEWATLPCVGSGQGCEGDIDCCAGLLCHGGTCLPASQACGFTGAACQSASDCCAPLACLETGLCGTPCGTAGTGCQSVSDCCSGLGCDQGSCTAASCTPATCAGQGFNCGLQGDGCGGQLDCGACASGSCGGGGSPGVCGSPCVATTCAAQGFDCGPAGDGCGGQLDCGTCNAPESCGGGGLPGACGSGTRCTPQGCAAQGIACGTAGDGCGHTLRCGGCDGGSCGGGGRPNVCGSPPCTPLTCAGQGYDCGATGDGCGGLLQCGACDGGSCGGGGRPNVCGAVIFH